MLTINRKKAHLWSRLGSRAVFGLAVLELAKQMEDFYVLSGDLCGSSGLTRFSEQFPRRFINMGIAEQNMIGVAGGLAKDGTSVLATSFAPFITMRAAEQVRMNMGYMQLNIKVVGLGSGLVMAKLGNSHYGLEDVAVMRAIPGVMIVSPADCTEIVKATEAIINYKGPVYLRLTGGSLNPVVYADDYDFRLGKAVTLREGKDLAIVAAGTMVHMSLKAADLLAKQGISTTVVDMHTIKPLDTECLDYLCQYNLLVTVEEHTIIGGLGGAVAEYLVAKKNHPRQIMLGIKDNYPNGGSYDYLLKQCGLTEGKIADRIKSALTNTNC